MLCEQCNQVGGFTSAPTQVSISLAVASFLQEFMHFLLLLMDIWFLHWQFARDGTGMMDVWHDPHYTLNQVPHSQFVSQLAGWRFVEAQVIMTGCWCTAGMLLQYDVFIFHTIHDGSGVFSTNSTAQQPDLRLRCKQTLVYTGAIKLSHFGVIVSCHHACWVPLWGSASWKSTQTLVVLKIGSHKLGDGTTCWWVWSPTYVSCT